MADRPFFLLLWVCALCLLAPPTQHGELLPLLPKLSCLHPAALLYYTHPFTALHSLHRIHRRRSFSDNYGADLQIPQLPARLKS